MKIHIIQFLDFQPGKDVPKKNEAVLHIKPQDKTGPAYIEKIVFKDAVKKISFEQLHELNFRIHNALDELQEIKAATMDLTVGDVRTAALMKPSTVNKFDQFVRGVYAKVKGSLNEKDQQTAEKALSIVDELLGKSK